MKTSGTDEQPILDSRYQLLQRLGEGGFATVHKAKHLELGTSCAIKIFKQLENYSYAKHLKEFQREAQVLWRLKHPGIVRIYHCGVTEDKRPYMVMELASGVSLRSRFTSGPISAQELIDILIQVVDALQYAHKRGFIHRDLKPENVVLCGKPPEQTAKILDFGLVKVLNKSGISAATATVTGTTVGTPLYMSPEQCVGGKIDHRADIYAVGCIAFEGLTGRPPYTGEPAEIMYQHVNIPIPVVTAEEESSSLAQRLAQVIINCLQKSPDDRYQSAADLNRDLKSILVDGSGMPARTNQASGLGAILSWHRSSHRQKSAWVIWACSPILLIIAGICWVNGQNGSKAVSSTVEIRRLLANDSRLAPTERLEKLQAWLKHGNSSNSAETASQHEQLCLKILALLKVSELTEESDPHEAKLVRAQAYTGISTIAAQRRILPWAITREVDKALKHVIDMGEQEQCRLAMERCQSAWEPQFKLDNNAFHFTNAKHLADIYVYTQQNAKLADFIKSIMRDRPEVMPSAITAKSEKSILSGVNSQASFDVLFNVAAEYYRKDDLGKAWSLWAALRETPIAQADPLRRVRTDQELVSVGRKYFSLQKPDYLNQALDALLEDFEMCNRERNADLAVCSANTLIEGLVCKGSLERALAILRTSQWAVTHAQHSNVADMSNYCRALGRFFIQNGDKERTRACLEIFTKPAMISAIAEVPREFSEIGDMRGFIDRASALVQPTGRLLAQTSAAKSALAAVSHETR